MKNLTDVQTIIDSISATSSPKEKVKIIKNNIDVEVFKKILIHTYDTCKYTYNARLSKIEMNFPEGVGFIDDHWDVVENLLEELRTDTHGRGWKQTEEITKVMSIFDKPSQNIISKILKRDLEIGIGKDLIKKAAPNLLTEFSPALAYLFNEKRFEKIRHEKGWYISHKLDGIRLLAVKTNNEWKLYSRHGKEFNTLENLIPELDAVTKGVPNIVFDGEICKMDKTNKEKESFKGIVKEISKKNHVIKDPYYIIFDCLTHEEFFSTTSTRVLTERWDYVKKLFGGKKYKTLKILEQVPFTEESFKEMQKIANDKGWEGLIVRKDTTYKGRRTHNMMKVKKFFDGEFKVIGYDLDILNFTTKGHGLIQQECLSSIKIEYKGTIVSVGSGFTNKQRLHYFKHPEHILGKMVKVQWFEETHNDKGGTSLRFPTLVHVFNEKKRMF